MRLAIIDLGTNSVRFDVHQIDAAKRVRSLHREKLMIRLGQNVFLTGKLDPEAVRRAIQAFKSFARTARSLRVEKIVAFGTSALREASDGERFLAQLRTQAGIEVRVIPGEEEAKLIALGVLARERALKGRFALVDIGGGSTEITVCSGRKVLHSASFPLGTARLQQVFLKTNPPQKPSRKNGFVDPVLELRRYIRGVLVAKLIPEEWPKRVPVVIGSSGTIRTFARMLGKPSKPGKRKNFERKDLSKLVQEMSGMSISQLLSLEAMDPRRVDMILAGGILLEECMQALGAKKARLTEYTLRDGILEEQIRLAERPSGSPVALHMADFWATARRFGRQENQLKQVTGLAGALFDALKPLHRLRPGWRDYLVAGAVLHDIGEAISPANHPRHSHYIVMHADFTGLDSWETEFLAQLCLHHASGKVAKKELPFSNDRSKRDGFLKLLALLRITDALHRGNKGGPLLSGIEIDRKAVRLQLSTRALPDLAILRVEQRKALFESVFRRKLLMGVRES